MYIYISLLVSLYPSPPPQAYTNAWFPGSGAAFGAGATRGDRRGRVRGHGGGGERQAGPGQSRNPWPETRNPKPEIRNPTCSGTAGGRSTTRWCRYHTDSQDLKSTG